MQNTPINQIIHKWNYLACWYLQSGMRGCKIAENFARQNPPIPDKPENLSNHYLLCRYSILASIISLRIKTHQILCGVDYLILKRAEQDRRLNDRKSRYSCPDSGQESTPLRPSSVVQDESSRHSASKRRKKQGPSVDPQAHYVLRAVESDAVLMIDFYDSAHQIIAGKPLVRDRSLIRELRLITRLADAITSGQWIFHDHSDKRNSELLDLVAQIKKFVPSIQSECTSKDNPLTRLPHDLAIWVNQVAYRCYKFELEPFFNDFFVSREKRYRFIHRLL